ncbi:hypothetical protein HPB48_009511 [Haemaphysalis longicornis]|uniref:Nuclease HARBI1 n=1 Tax=Haemaphysalis longicornis TaxID=44386 RepID=A0A9J6GDJ1_HAELO|nr:hypothetical protein HPB48_009511 [Haemaphysalis longicornis]
MQQQHLQAEIEEIDEELRQTAKRRKLRMAAIMRLCSRERRVWSYHRSGSWYDTTLPNLPDSAFRENFRVSSTTFTYIVNACECMRRQDTNMRRAIPLDKRVAIGLYRLASSAEERTVAHLFGVSRPLVNLIFREFCRVVVRHLEHLYIKFPRPCEMAEHLRQFEAVLGFPRELVALDGCHLEVCPPTVMRPTTTTTRVGTASFCWRLRTTTTSSCRQMLDHLGRTMIPMFLPQVEAARCPG